MHIYLYKRDNSNFRNIYLIPTEIARISDVKLSDLEGMVEAEKKIPQEQLNFSRTKKEEIIKEYGARFIEF